MDQLSFSLFASAQIKFPLKITATELELPKQQPPLSSEIFRDPRIAFVGSNTKDAFEFYLTLELWAGNKRLWPELRTRYRYNKTKKVRWNETLVFPDICALPLDAQLAITVWDVRGPGQKYPLAGTTIRVYDQDGVLRKGRQKLLLHRDRAADPFENTSTPSESTEVTELDRLEERIKSHEAGDLPRIDWLDNLAFRQLEKLAAQPSTSEHSYLILEFPRFDFPVVYTTQEHRYTIKAGQQHHKHTMVMVHDPDAANANPVEIKHRKLVRSHRTGQVDRDLKPSPRVRDTLFEIVSSPVSTDLTSEDKDLLWKFRYFLAKQTRVRAALPKFLRAVVWTDATEATQAVALLSRWQMVSVECALELLGPAFTNEEVRRFAVSRLAAASEADITLYLLQLVQALRYEPASSPLKSLLIERAQANERIAGQLFWYLNVEGASPPIFLKTKEELLLALPETSSLEAQEAFVGDLTKMAEAIKASKETRPKRIERLRAWASEHTFSEPIPFPLDPTMKLVGFEPEKCSVFKSSLFPLRLSLRLTTGAHFDCIFKSGDDLRQDQLVIQIIAVFNELLLKENLDLKLTPYRILATSVASGFVEFVASESLAAILSEYGTIGSYLGATSTRKVPEEMMDNYVRSCAGYCVITYLLGVGDRHLDNLLLTRDGHFFHADFGFILGRDPKPFAPALKLAKEMVDVMNSNSPEHDPQLWYARFKGHCFTAFAALRKNAAVILNLFELMTDASIPDIRAEPKRAVAKIVERFCLDMDESQSMRFFEDLLVESVSALFPVFIDRVHHIAQYWRA
ncbi:Phosphatidylinositol (PI) 3-kinase [Savitreella phatthalungensis]